MKELILNNFVFFLIISIFFTRIIDILFTYIISPELVLETNPVVRKFRWPSAISTIFLSLVPLISVHMGIVILTMSLISSSLNIRKTWMMKTIGEEKILNTTVECIKANGMLKISFFEFLSSLFWISLFMLLLILNNGNNYVFWFGISLGAYGVLSFVYYVYYLYSIRKKHILFVNNSESYNN